MKKTALLLFIFISAIAHAQTFEGIMSWKITTEMDASTKAKVDEAQKKLKDPATQAQMKEMKEKMNDPQFKAMMDANPQLKAQMDQILKMAEGGEVNSLLPTGLTVKMKNGNTLTKMEGGMMGNMEVLFLKDKNMTYQLNRESKTYTAFPATQSTDSLKVSDVKVTKTSETAKILNYNCTKYIAESVWQGKPVKQIFWTTTAIKDIDMKSLARQRMGNNQQSMFFEKIDGVPLKIEMNQAEIGMVMEVTELKRQSLSASDFSIPAGFKENK